MSKKLFYFLAGPVFTAGVLVGSLLSLPARAGKDGSLGPLRSQVVTWDRAPSQVGPWGEMRRYFQGETYNTTSLLAAVAVIKPGESLHPAHRHAEEEFLMITEGSGKWHLDGKEFAAGKGDVLYVAPWVMHGVVNTGSAPLTFFVVRYNGKGIKPPAAPPGDHGK
jgi:mannose-6-phosphate isomerase-like protein (cupin superfamily)